MNGELAALMAVVMHGNAWLANPNSDPPSLERDNTTYRYVRSLTFVEPRQGLFRRERRYEGTAAWLEAQRDAGVRTLELFSPTSIPGKLPAPIATSFANGVPRGVVAVGPTPTLWSSAWNADGTDHPRGEIWRVTMTSVGLGPTPTGQPTPVVDARDSLLGAVHAARDFAAANDLEGWTEWFVKALDVAESLDPEVPYNPDMAPAGSLVLEERQLLAAAVQSWVFGGMGSWNDIWLSDESQTARYEKVTEQLYAAVIESLVAVANARN